MGDLIQTDKIKHQQEVAKEVLHKLEILDPYCILAGGAPRNWFLGKEANDLDFYVHLNETLYATELRFENLGFKAKHIKFDSDGWKDYGLMEHLFRIFELEYKDMKIQIMCMRKSTFTSVVPCFGVSICKFWWKGYDVNPTDEALTSLITKTLYIKDDYTAKELHVEKMKNYFPSFKVRPHRNWKEDYLLSVTMEEHYQGGFGYYNKHLLNKAEQSIKELLHE